MPVGGQPGNNNAGKGKMMRSVIKQRLEERQAAVLIADALIEKAIDGDLGAIKEVNDRLDGKAPQAIDHTVNTHEQSIDDLE